MADAREVAREGTEAFNAHDEQRIRASYADNARFEGPGDIKLEGADAVAGYALGWLNAFPDARLDVHNELVCGDWVVQQFTFRGTHTETLAGPTGDVPATNRRLEGRGVQVIRVKNGKVAEEHLYYDQVDVLTQLGLMPAAAGATA
jgi:steroid delta-isomerase-like uncharacterized protein